MIRIVADRRTPRIRVVYTSPREWAPTVRERVHRAVRRALVDVASVIEKEWVERVMGNLGKSRPYVLTAMGKQRPVRTGTSTSSVDLGMWRYDVPDELQTVRGGDPRARPNALGRMMEMGTAEPFDLKPSLLQGRSSRPITSERSRKRGRSGRYAIVPMGKARGLPEMGIPASPAEEFRTVSNASPPSSWWWSPVAGRAGRSPMARDLRPRLRFRSLQDMRGGVAAYTEERVREIVDRAVRLARG